MSARLSEEVICAVLAEKNWEPVEGWEYTNSLTPIPGRCLVEGCGYESPPDTSPRLNDLKNSKDRGACLRCAGQEKPSVEKIHKLLAEKHWEPIEGWEYVNSKTLIPGRCLVEGCGYESPPDKGPIYNNLNKGRGACFRCSGNEKPSEEIIRNLLAEKNWEPITGWEYVDNRTKVDGRCLVCGYESGPDGGPWYSHLQQGQGACLSCSENGYDPSKPGWFYRFEFIDQDQTFLCYGITSDLDTRRKHYERKLEIKNFQSLHFDKGSIPQELEKQFHEIRQESSAPASTCGVAGTITESFSLSPENWDLFTVFEAHWAAAALRIPDLQEIA